MMKKIIKMLCITITFGFMTPILASNNDVGTVVGGIAGGLIGNNIGSGRALPTIGGAIIGSLVGNQVSSNMSHQYPCSHFESYQTPHRHYRNTYIGEDGRLYRRSAFVNEFGDRIFINYCCYRMSPHGFCNHWVRVS